MIRAILFDLDDTLVDREAATDVFLGTQYLAARLDQVPFAAYRRRFRELDEHGYACRSRVLRALVTEYGLRASAHELEAEFRRCVWENARLYPSARGTLQELRALGYRLGIVTNGTVSAQRAKLAATGLRALVDTVLISEEEGIDKPETDIFCRTALRLVAAPAECLFVGDNPHSDIHGARGAGMTTAWLAGRMPWPAGLAFTPDHTIRDVGEVLGLVAHRLGP